MAHPIVVVLTRLIDFLKTRGITAMFASLTNAAESFETNESMISSLMDSWVLVATHQVGNERERKIYVLKSRGMPHSDEVRRFRFTSHGIELLPSARGTTSARKLSAAGGKRAVRRRK